MNVLAIAKRLELVPQGMIIVISGFLPLFAIVSMFPALPAIIEHFSDHPNARELVPLAVSAPGLTIAILAPFAGYFVDRFGRLPLLIWGTGLYGICGILPFFFDSLYLLFLSRFALGACEAAILTVVNTLIGDYWEDEGRRDWLLLQGVAGPVLGAVSIWAAGPATEIRWNGVFLIYGVAFIICILMKLFLFEPKRGAADAAEPRSRKDNGDHNVKSAFPTLTFVKIGGLTLLASALYYVFIISGGLVFREFGISEPSRISDLSAIPSLFICVGALIFRMLGKYDSKIQLSAFFAVLGAGLVLIGTASSIPLLVFGLIVQQTGAGMVIGTLIAWAQTLLPYEHRGRGMGIWTACFFFGQFSSPWLVARAESMLGSMKSTFVFSGACGIAIALAIYLVFIAAKFKTPSHQNV